jgi:hypothetical protein
VYPVSNPALDSSFAGGTVTRKLNYFNVPITAKYVFPNHIFLEAGPMLGLLYKAYDHMHQSVNGSDLTYDIDIRDQFYALDAGILAGAGWRMMKGNGINFVLRYYYGLVNVMKNNVGGSVRNQSLYINVGIPVGAGKAKEKAKAEEKSKQ